MYSKLGKLMCKAFTAEVRNVVGFAVGKLLTKVVDVVVAGV